MPETALILDFEQSVKSTQNNFYKVIQTIGSGKNASAHLVLQTSNENNGTIRVMKILNDPANPDQLRKFSQEMATLRAFNHNSIMQISDNGEFVTRTAKYPFYVCDYYNETLSGVISKDSASLFQKVSFAIQLCSAMAYLASKNTIHCDIKPDNIFIDGIKCILGDFGLVTEKSSHFNYSLPSLHKYRSPDIVKAMRGEEKLTAKSDVFLAGLTLAELFIGKNICEESTDGDSDVKLINEISVKGKYGAKISSIITEMLAFNVDQRPRAVDCVNKWEIILFNIGADLYTLNGKII